MTPQQKLDDLMLLRDGMAVRGENTTTIDQQIAQLDAYIDRRRQTESVARQRESLRQQAEAAAAAGDSDKFNGIMGALNKLDETTVSANETRTNLANANRAGAEDTANANSGSGTAGSGSTPAPETDRRRGYDPYDPYGRPREGIGGKIVEGLFGIGGALLQSWLNGGQNDEERAAMDRIFANNDAAMANQDPANNGTPIYGPNGEIIGYDRTGDNQPDTRDSDGDGQPDTFTGGSYDDDYTDYSDPSEFAYDDYTNTDNSDAFATPPVSATGGGASTGGAAGASLGGDIGGGDEDGEGEDEDEEGEDEDEEGEGEDDEDEEDLADADDDDKKSRSKSGDDDDAAEVKDYVGRIFVLPKDAITAAAAAPAAVGNRAAGDDDGFADDGWNDSDNGDWADEEDDWGWEENEWGDEPAKPAANPATPAEPGVPGVPAMGAELTPEEELLKQEIIKVEAEIAKWQKAERDKKLQQEDPYSFETTRAMQDQADDPFKAYRNEDGKLDLTKVNVWIVVDDSWKEPEAADGAEQDPMAPAAKDYSPVRMRLIVPDELLDRFEPVQGGWVSLRGTPVEAEFNPAVFPGLKGSVQDLDLVQVLAVTKEQPANLDDTEYSDY